MVLIKYDKLTFSTAYNFLNDISCTDKERSDFLEFLEEENPKIKKEIILAQMDIENKDEEPNEILMNILYEYGWNDEDIIMWFLERRNKKYIIEYVDEGNGYFKIYEMKEEEENGSMPKL